MRPKVILFDEITSALDPERAGEVLNVIRQLGAEHNLTMPMVTHQMGLTREFADRVCFEGLEGADVGRNGVVMAEAVHHQPRLPPVRCVIRHKVARIRRAGPVRAGDHRA